MNKQAFYTLATALLTLLAADISAASDSAPIAAYEIVKAESEYTYDNIMQLRAKCPGDKRVLGAGWSVLDINDTILDGQALFSQPAYDGSGWMVNATNLSASYAPKWKLRLRLICAKVDAY
ncbi:MAG: hypothetical protein OIF35_01035 [Cellvibrionaceae bacterium]|nr:hypothetical protein [Cellvibrionaceae bacterium]MCV6624575.1 hypothetical protein [Cellvibrionaceae bacterium]